MFEFIGVAVVIAGLYVAYKKGYLTALINKFKKAPAAPTTPVVSKPPTPVIEPTVPPVHNDNDVNGFYVDAGVTHPDFKGFGICLLSEASKFAPTSHEAKCIAFNVAQIDEQKQIIGFNPGNTCYQVDVNGQGNGVQIPNTIRCPSSVSGRDAAKAYINSLPVIVIHN